MLKEIAEMFSCDCHSDDHIMQTTLLGDQCLIVELHKDWANRGLWDRVVDGLKLFWEVVWHKSTSQELVLSRQEHKRFKTFVSNLVEVPCPECNPDIKAEKHSH